MASFFNRPPRIQPELPLGEINIPNPPSSSNFAGRFGLITLFIPIVTILGYSFVASRGGSIIYVLPMGFAAIITSAVGYLNWRRGLQQEEQRQKKYADLLKQLRDQMSTKHDQQQKFYLHNFPPPTTLSHIARTNDARLWERRPEDQDFAMSRLGQGRMLSTVQFKSSGIETSDAPLASDALKLMDDYRYVQNVPIAMALSHTHAVGVAGNEHRLTADFGRALLVHLATLHAPSDLRLFVVGSSESKQEWYWSRWLPHCSTTRNEQGTGEQLCFESNQLSAFWEKIQAELERRQTRRQHDQSSNLSLPFLIILVDMFDDKRGDSPIEEVVAETAVTTIMNYGKALGAAIVFLVNDKRVIPSECSAVVTLTTSSEGSFFRYDEVGVNAPHHEGRADQVDIATAETFARQLAPLSVRTTYGADLPLSLTLTDLMGREIVESAVLLKTWQKSLLETADWPKVPIGMTIGNKVREITFSASADGVHGLIAGTTGTGKSELLTSLIIGLAVRYHPSLVNFVLVDYKGGTAFEGLRNLPHTVDVITNLQGQVGLRAFTALRVELARRNELLARTSTRNLVDYRQKGFHDPSDPDRAFPHLFVIVDEFAEMVRDRPEFKPFLDSIARLGRAPGVHLILATQKPGGVVSDQIRANVKFRACLRVESPEDSREILGRADAAFLPPNIPGRAYLQVGNQQLELVQVAHSGSTYQGSQTDTRPDVIFLNRQRQRTNIQSQPGGFVQTVSDVIVSKTDALVVDKANSIEQPRKRWHDPLPEYLALSEFSETTAKWLDKEWQQTSEHWQGIKWDTQAMRAVIGRVDNLTSAEQPDLVLNLNESHIVVIGTSGSGKTGFLRTLILSLVSSHSPEELNLYFLDFGGHGLDVFLELPHLGDSITAQHGEKLQRLLRKLSNDIEERQILFSRHQVNNLSEYNLKNPDHKLPAILLVLDNFADFRDSFPNETENFALIAANSRANGIHIVVTAEQLTSIPPRIFNLFSERIALRLADSIEYGGVLGSVGNSIRGITEVAGRGYIRREQAALEFQTAISVPNRMMAEGDKKAPSDRVVLPTEDQSQLHILCQRMRQYWQGNCPQPIDILQTIIRLQSLQDIATSNSCDAVIGRKDLDLKPALIDLKAYGPHFIVAGLPLSGKTTLLHTWMLSLAQRYAPTQISFFLIDYQQRFFRYGGRHLFSDLPHVVETYAETNGVEKLVDRLRQLYDDWHNNPRQEHPEIIVFIDNFDDFAGVLGTSPGLWTKLGELARQFGVDGLHFVVAGGSTVPNMSNAFMTAVKSPRYGFALDPRDAVTALGASIRSSSNNSEFPPGRGYLVKSGRPALIQAATYQREGLDAPKSLDAWIDEMIQRYPARGINW